MQRNDAGATTVGEYLVRLLEELWTTGEGFSGKRPFGNSNWEWEVYEALVKARFVEGTLDEDGYLEDADSKKADALILEAIRTLKPGG
jgi:hypothetical protein